MLEVPNHLFFVGIAPCQTEEPECSVQAELTKVHSRNSGLLASSEMRVKIVQNFDVRDDTYLFTSDKPDLRAKT